MQGIDITKTHCTNAQRHLGMWGEHGGDRGRGFELLLHCCCMGLNTAHMHYIQFSKVQGNPYRLLILHHTHCLNAQKQLWVYEAFEELVGILVGLPPTHCP